MTKTALIVFAKNPIRGKVKTRLAATEGDDMALAVYQQLLMHTRKTVSNLAVDQIIYYLDETVQSEYWEGYPLRKQSEGSLGQKMYQAISHELQIYDRVGIIGTDCAQLTSQVLTEAFDALLTKDFVVGPANDGGYYLLGMHQMQEDLFVNMEWSTDQVFNETVNRILMQRKTIHTLPELIDVDTIDDWNLVSENFD